MNLVRIVSLYYIGQHNRQWFEFAHLYAWENLIVLITLAIFWNWVQRVMGESGSEGEPRYLTA